MNPEMHDLVGAYCTDALDPDERDRFETHLAHCAACRVEARAYFDVLATMGSAHPVTPPADLEDSVVGTALGTGPRPGPAVAAGATAEPGPTGISASSSPADRGGSGHDRRPGGPTGGSWRRAATWFAAAAAGAVLFAGGFVTGSSQHSTDTVAHDEMATVVAVASAPDAHFLAVDLMGTQSRVVMSGEMDKSAFMASELPIPAKGMCYQVWRVTSDGAMESAGAFTPDADGHIVTVLEGSTRDVTKYMITMEPPGGSEHPTGTMLSEVRT